MISKMFFCVSTVAFGILFAHFPAVECISNSSGFLFMTSWLIKNVSVERERSLSMGGAIIFLALFPQNYIKSGTFSFISCFYSKWCQRKATYGRNTLNCRKMSKKNARCYSQDYFFSDNISLESDCVNVTSFSWWFTHFSHDQGPIL